MVCQHLARLGCEAVPLDSGEACLAELERRVPALVLMDLRMEGMQGDEACRRVKAHPARQRRARRDAHQRQRSARGDALRARGRGRLPAQARGAGGADGQGARGARGSRSPRGRGLHRALGVLLVEGSRSLGSFLGGALEHEGFHVLYARQAEEAEALAAAHGSRLDGLVVDVSRSCAFQDGLALAERLRALLPRKPLVLVAGVEESADVHARAKALTGEPLLERRHAGAGRAGGARAGAARAGGDPDARRRARAPLLRGGVLHAAAVRSLTGFSSDASPEALFVRTLTPARAGARLSLRVTLAGQRIPSTVEAVVAWSNPLRQGAAFQAPAGMGLRLERVDTVLAAQLQRFVPRALGFSLAVPVRILRFLRGLERLQAPEIPAAPPWHVGGRAPRDTRLRLPLAGSPRLGRSITEESMKWLRYGGLGAGAGGGGL